MEPRDKCPGNELMTWKPGKVTSEAMKVSGLLSTHKSKLGWSPEVRMYLIGWVARKQGDLNSRAAKHSIDFHSRPFMFDAKQMFPQRLNNDML